MGTGNIAWRHRKCSPFKEARDFVHTQKLKNYKQWKEYCKTGNKPRDIPVHPPEVYKENGWVSWGDWLGTGNIASRHRKYRSCKEARDFARSLNLKTYDQWQEYCKSGEKPEDIPSNPRRVYKDECWKGNGDWLGTGNVANGLKKYKLFKDARDFVHTQKLKNKGEWAEYSKSGRKPDDIPANPKSHYMSKGWIGWGDWLGTGNTATFLREYKSFKAARAFVHTRKLKNESDWRKYCKSGDKPDDIPASPSHVYRDKGWNGWGDWLGKNSN